MQIHKGCGILVKRGEENFDVDKYKKDHEADVAKNET